LRLLFVCRSKSVVKCLRCREESNHYGSECVQADGNSCFQSSVDVDVVYVGPSTGNTFDDECADHAMSSSRADCLRHRSVFIDPEMTSFPPRLLGQVTHRRIDNMSQLPVTSVCFHRVCLSELLAERLADVLRRHRSFRVMSFVKCHRLDDCLLRIRQILVDWNYDSWSKLSRLQVRLSRIDDVNAVAELGQVFLTSLHALSLTGCSIMSAGCAKVVRSLVAGSRCLLELDLGFNDMADVGALVDALAANCSLRSLRLKGNAIGSEGAGAMFSALRRNYRLELLDLGGNPVGERPEASDLWRVMAECLLSNRTLRELNLERCGLGVDASSALGRSLASNSTLRVLDVSANQLIGDTGVAFLADGLRRNIRSGVHTLALNMCAIGDVGFRSLLVAIKDGGATQLRHVKLCYNRISSRDQLRRMRLDRRRPVSDHFEVSSSEASHLSSARSDIISPLSCGNDRRTKPTPSSTPTRRRGTSHARPVSSIDTSQNALVEGTDENSQSVSDQKRITLHYDNQGLVNNGYSTTSGSAFNQDSRPSESTSCLRSVVDSVRNANAVSELSTLSEHARDNSPLDRSASSVLDMTERSTLVDRRGTTTPESVDVGHFPTATTGKARDAEETGDVSIYLLLCRVLRANPRLKFLLWGNQIWHCGGGTTSKTAEEMDSSVVVEPETNVDSSVGSFTTPANSLHRKTAATLPRNYQF